MKTQEALDRFLKKCEERGLSPETRRTYYSRLRYFALEYPELPVTTPPIERFLQARHETPAKRGDIFKILQAFYAYLENYEGIPSPVPPKGKVGRPPRRKLVLTDSPENPEGAVDYASQKLVQGGRPPSSYTSISTAAAVKDFLRSRELRGCTPTTIDDYSKFLGPFAARFPVLPVKPEPIEEFLASLKVNSVTRWDYCHNIKILYRFLEKRKRIQRDLFEFPRVKKDRFVRRILSEEELVSLIAYCRDFLEKCVIYTLIDSKCRAGELVSMVRENLHPDHILVSGKTGERIVPLTTGTSDLLKMLAPSGPLFCLNGKPMTTDQLYKLVHNLMIRAGLTGKKLGPHILRHSASVQHMLKGGDLLTLQGELGHTTPQMTAHYARLAMDQVTTKHQVVNVLGKLVDQAAPPPPPEKPKKTTPGVSPGQMELMR